MSGREPTGLRELSSLLGEGASFEGKLLFEGRVRIDGKFRGDIVSDDVLILGEHADVDAKIEVGTLIVLGGTLRGEVRAQRTVELHAPAKVFGNITAPQLMIDRGVQFEGQSRTSSEAPRSEPAQAETGTRPAIAPAEPEQPDTTQPAKD
jgi:cytoskeletal protein CcmA (bactofilin family)